LRHPFISCARVRSVWARAGGAQDQFRRRDLPVELIIMGALLESRHWVYIFIIALTFLFAVLTRKSIWIYWVSAPDVEKAPCRPCLSEFRVLELKEY
jgi:hypothetical protein